MLNILFSPFSFSRCSSPSPSHTGETIAEVKETGGAPADSPPPGGTSLLTLLTVVGGLLLALNLALIYCYLRRRAAKHLFGKPVRASKHD